MTDEAKDAEIGRLTKQYAETKKTLACLNNSLHADADKLIHLAESIKGNIGQVIVPDGLDLPKVAERLAELSATMTEHTRLERCLEQAGLGDLIKRPLG